MSKTNQAVFTRQPMAQPFDPPRQRPHAAPMQPMAPQSSPRQLTAQFVGGAEAQHDHSSRKVIEGLIIGAGVGAAWSAWQRYKRRP